MRYSAAHPSAFGRFMRTFARSSNPGVLGSNGRNASRGTPAASALRRKSSREMRKFVTASLSPSKSATATSHCAISSVSSGASSSSSSTRVPSSYSMYPYSPAIFAFLAAVRLPKRYNAIAAFSQNVNADEKPSLVCDVRHFSVFTIVATQICNFVSAVQIHLARALKPNPMFGPVGGALTLVPLKFHAPQLRAGMVTNSLTEVRT